MSNKGIHFLDIDATKRHDFAMDVSFMEDCAQVDKFAEVMQLCQELSHDGTAFQPEWIFNSELPEEIKLYLRNIFQQKIQPLSFGVDTSQLSDDDLIEFSPHDGESLNDYRDRVIAFTNKLKEGDS